MEDWVDLIIPNLNGGKRGDRASQRAKAIARANKWKLGIRGATWLGQGNSREHYEDRTAIHDRQQSYANGRGGQTDDTWSMAKRPYRGS